MRKVKIVITTDEKSCRYWVDGACDYFTRKCGRVVNCKDISLCEMYRESV